MIGGKRGWFGESHRHYLASKGILTRNKYFGIINRKQVTYGYRPATLKGEEGFVVTVKGGPNKLSERPVRSPSDSVFFTDEESAKKYAEGSNQRAFREKSLVPKPLFEKNEDGINVEVYPGVTTVSDDRGNKKKYSGYSAKEAEDLFKEEFADEGEE